MTPSGRDLIAYWAPPAAWAAGIFIQSSLPPAVELPDVSGSDKILHALVFGVLAMLVFRALASTAWRFRPRLLFWSAFLLTAAYGVSDELHQAFVPSRSPEIMDAAADAAGALAALWLCRLAHRPQPRAR